MGDVVAGVSGVCFGHRLNFYFVYFEDFVYSAGPPSIKSHVAEQIGQY